MAFVKVKSVDSIYEDIINTNTICQICKGKKRGTYSVYFSNDRSYPEVYDESEAKKIFEAIGVSLNW